MLNKTSDTPPAWMEMERKRMEERRRIAGRGLTNDSDGSPVLVGLALSGGGIRSATLSLGMLQALAKADALPEIDAVSTVSGGGYTGGFLCSLFMPKPRREGDLKWKAEDSDLQKAAAEALVHLKAIEQRANAGPAADAAPISWLRDCGRYLAPNGGGDVWTAFTTWLRNFLAVHYVIGLTLLLGLMLLGWANDVSQQSIPKAGWLENVPAVLEPGLLYGLLAGLVLAVALLPLGIGYWYTEMPKGRFAGVRAGLTTDTALIGVAMGPLLWIAWTMADLGEQFAYGWLIAFELVLSSAWYVGAWLRTCTAAPDDLPMARMLVTRTRLTRWLSVALSLTLALAALCLILVASRVCLDWLRAHHPALGISGAGLLSAVLAIWKLVPSRVTPAERALAVQWLPLIGALVVGAALVLAWGMVAAWWLESKELTGFLLGSLTILALITGRSFQFLNLSTIQNLYTARIVRAYLGASNRARRNEAKGQDKTEPHAKDDMTLDQYYGAWDAQGRVHLTSLAPMHLINVTINETKVRQSSLVNQDRKGLPLTVTPDGYLIDGKYQARNAGKQGAPPDLEQMSLGRWIGISGAAVAPGLGRGTRPERALLMVLANARLGYWWKARLDGTAEAQPTQRLPFSTQVHLYREMRASFRGTDDSHWYLSDGGHLENTGVYALLRRRMHFILALDNGADADYQFDDIANLMRLASVDLGAQFTPITAASLEPKLKGTPAAGLLSLLGNPNGFARDSGQEAHFLQAYRVVLPAADGQGRHEAVLLWVKPRLTAQAGLDLRQYQATHTAFPQETTADQFFDDEQWESYRQLGELAGKIVLDRGLWPSGGLSGLVKALQP